MKIILTGASGFIGFSILKKLQHIYDIVVLVRDTSDTSKLVNINCTVVQYNSYMDIMKIFAVYKPMGVIHCASNVVGEHQANQLEELLKSNIIYPTFLLEACKSMNTKWFLNTGTYWQNYNSDEYNPVNLYAATKESVETIAKYYTETSNLIFTTIKLYDTVGPNDTRPKIFNLWKKIAETGEYLDMSAGKQIMDISYIDDIVEAYLVLINHLNSTNGMEFQNKIYAVKSLERISLKEMAKIFEDVIGKRLHINWGAKKYKNREVMLPVDNIQSIPGWEPKYSLKETIKFSIGDM